MCMQRAVLQGLAVFRWIAWAWMATVLLLSRQRLDHPLVAGALVAAALAVTAGCGAAWRVRPAVLLTAPVVAAEVALGSALVLADGWVYGPHHAFATSQSLGSVWPLVGVLAAGVAGGPFVGVAVGVAMGASRLGATLWNGESIDRTGEVLSLVNTTVLYAVAGTVAGYLYRLLVRAEREVSDARAREEVARTLHDGVLQTLALVERRVGDPALSRLAREQELELRTFLFGARTAPTGHSGPDGLAGALRAAAARYEGSYGGRVDVVVAPDLPALAEDRVRAVAGEVGEALTNAGKHGGASRVTVYAEPDDDDTGVFCSVKDDGSGFDPALVPDGVGLSRSIRARMAELGGRAAPP
jgi:signal transduction histidine kinase